MAEGPGTAKCYRCGEIKPLDAFAGHGKPARRDSLCRPCRSEYGKEHYAKTRQRYIDQARVVSQRVRRERTAHLIQYFKANPCGDCGEQDPVVLEFDHLRDKAFDIAGGITGRGWQSLLDEIGKCEVVCANCHRRRTARRQRSVRMLLAEVGDLGGQAGDRT